MHDLTDKRERIEYLHLVKDTCASCDDPIEPGVERYERDGNYCRQCIFKVNAAIIRRKYTESELNRAFRRW